MRFMRFVRFVRIAFELWHLVTVAPLLTATYAYARARVCVRCERSNPITIRFDTFLFMSQIYRSYEGLTAFCTPTLLWSRSEKNSFRPCVPTPTGIGCSPRTASRRKWLIP